MCAPPQSVRFHSGGSYLEGKPGLHFPGIIAADGQPVWKRAGGSSRWRRGLGQAEVCTPGPKVLLRHCPDFPTAPFLKDFFSSHLLFTSKSQAEVGASFRLAEPSLSVLIYCQVFTWWDGFVLHAFNPTLTHASKCCQSGFRKYISLMHLCSHVVTWYFKSGSRINM